MVLTAANAAIVVQFAGSSEACKPAPDSLIAHYIIPLCTFCEFDSYFFGNCSQGRHQISSAAGASPKKWILSDTFVPNAVV